MKIALVVPIGRYMPIATSMGLRTLNMIIAKPIRMPVITSGHAMSPPTMPCASEAISPACGAERSLSPNPMPPLLMLPTCSHSSGKYITQLATTTAISSVI